MIKIEEKILKLEDEIREFRTVLHQCPEKGLEEVKTSAYIREKLKVFGVDQVESCPATGTGVIGVLKGPQGAGGKKIAFRADMDGLPLQESSSFAFPSANGMMHACGHDGHMSALLGFAKYLCENRELLKNDVVFVFQPAEEGPGGAKIMIKGGLLKKYGIEKIIGLHIFPAFKQGEIACKSGALMARNGEMTFTVRGVKSHGAMPQNGRDAIVCASNLVLALQTIVSRNINPLQGSLLTIGTLSGGEAKNIIASKVVIGGTIRAFDDEVYDTLTARIQEIAKGVGAAYGCEVDVEFFHMYRVVKNNKEMTEALKAVVGSESYVEAEPVMISEDFSLFQHEVDGLFFFVGSYNEKKGHIHPLHSEKFNFDEEILLSALQVYKNLLIALS